ncbi:YbaN family protein [Patescibacteria group bacterium]|nr:YbaN family protein [Patescibacteria group bacterium]
MPQKLIKVFWVSAGVLFTLLGILGIFLPILPVIPFLFLASTCFLRGSKRIHIKFEKVFLKNKYYEKYLKKYIENKRFIKGAKIFFIIWTWSFTAYSCFYVFDSRLAQIGAVVVAIGVTVFITTLNPLKKPSGTIDIEI